MLRSRSNDYGDHVKRFMELQDLKNPTEAEVIEYNLMCAENYRQLKKWQVTRPLKVYRSSQIIGVSSKLGVVSAEILHCFASKQLRVVITTDHNIEWTARFVQISQKRWELVTTDMSSAYNITLKNHTKKYELPDKVYNPVDYAKAYFNNVILATDVSTEQQATQTNIQGEMVS